ncbi:MAG: tyrosine-type recombinase/integrase [Ignavibacteria bacterium]|nr:tyrosine-type recombinase/integrase [Ignavibacteria bacterium]
MQEILRNIEEDFSLEEIIRLQSLLNNIKLTKEEELKESETVFKFSIDYLKMIEYTFSEKYYSSIQTTFNHLIKFFGEDCLVVSIRPKDAESFKQHIMKSAPKGYLVYLRNLKAAFNRALTWELISINPFAKIDIKKNQKRKPDFINCSELHQILGNVKNHKLKKLYVFAFYTGSRLGECVSLKWKNIDSKESLIVIGDDDFVTKSKKVRTIPIANEIQDFLMAGYSITKNKNSYIFSKSNGFPFRKEYISKIFKKAVIDSGINKKIHFHSLRHSFATNLVLAGAPITVVSELMGHSSILVTQIYAHTDLSAMRTAVAKFN